MADKQPLLLHHWWGHSCILTVCAMIFHPYSILWGQTVSQCSQTISPKDSKMHICHFFSHKTVISSKMTEMTERQMNIICYVKVTTTLLLQWQNCACGGDSGMWVKFMAHQTHLKHRPNLLEIINLLFSFSRAALETKLDESALCALDSRYRTYSPINSPNNSHDIYIKSK